MFKKFFVLLLVVFLFSCSNYSSDNNYIEAKVNKIVSSITLESENSDEKIKEISLELTTSKGETILIKQKFYLKNLKEPVEGDNVILSEVITNDGELDLQIVDYKRINIVYISIILFIITILIWGKVKSLFFIFILLFIILSYKIFYSVAFLNPLFTSFVFCTLVSFIINSLIYRKKEVIIKLFISNLLGIIFVIFISYIYSKYSYFDSILYEKISSTDIPSVNSLITSSILISSLGLIIYSSINSFNNYNELVISHPNKNRNKLLNIAIRKIKPSIFLNILKIYFIYIGLSFPIIVKNNYNNILNTDIIVFYIISFSILSISSLLSSIFIIYLIKDLRLDSKNYNF